MGNIQEALMELETPNLVGATMSNNATIIKAYYQYGETFVVLAVRGGNTLHPFVVWNMDYVFNEAGEVELRPYKGDYCETLEHALEMYDKRGGQ
jgi:hypothetical protein